jgi:MFS family permease
MSSIRRFSRFKRVPSTGLWRSRDFLNLWCADSISQFGNQISALAIPLIAVLTLHASPLAVGLLTAAGQTPSLLFSLLAGAWIDRFRRRPVLIAANLSSAATLALVPLAAVLDIISIPLLCAITFLAGTLAIVFDLAYTSYLPRLVGREHLVEANSKLEASASIAQVGGPGLAGVLVGLFTAPFAVLLDACSFLGSALLMSRITLPEPSPARQADRSKLRAEIGEGLRFLIKNPTLRALAGSSSTTKFFSAGFFSVYLLFLARNLDLGPTTIGLILATGGVGAFIGAMLGRPLLHRLGLGGAMIVSSALFGLTGLLIPLAVLAPRIALPMVIASEFLQWLFTVAYAVNAISLRQSVVPDEMQGRINGAYRFMTLGANPLGAAAGGLLGGLIGLPWTLVVTEIGMLTAVGWLVFSPVRGMRTYPRLEPPVPTSVAAV